MLGKPAFNDVKEGIITAPLIYSMLDYKSRGKMAEFSELNAMVQNHFSN
jgi:geranylgeranyl pyrophosphate synthase